MHILFDVIGASGGTRTPDRLITNQQLYQLSYAGSLEGTKIQDRHNTWTIHLSR